MAVNQQEWQQKSINHPTHSPRRQIGVSSPQTQCHITIHQHSRVLNFMTNLKMKVVLELTYSDSRRSQTDTFNCIISVRHGRLRWLVFRPPVLGPLQPSAPTFFLQFPPTLSELLFRNCDFCTKLFAHFTPKKRKDITNEITNARNNRQVIDFYGGGTGLLVDTKWIFHLFLMKYNICKI